MPHTIRHANRAGWHPQTRLGVEAIRCPPNSPSNKFECATHCDIQPAVRNHPFFAYAASTFLIAFAICRMCVTPSVGQQMVKKVFFW